MYLAGPAQGCSELAQLCTAQPQLLQPQLLQLLLFNSSVLAMV